MLIINKNIAYVDYQINNYFASSLLRRRALHILEIIVTVMMDSYKIIDHFNNNLYQKSKKSIW
jgi:hypothetical protein